ncbi:EAL domain-containing protein [Paraglaciecola aquimarina]|uniref:EAL domain-containing protein n=1 Tax=Paraglaciecola algarum TaxID=3050085 RepID=A0ABS9D822_9ALTE|nr:EAL domain-containing protein [Paraglaciecola sp. G1-23]MCF2949026.1 EAL domain-containing protein [Paraglaciecola sp. G1-23]
MDTSLFHDLGLLDCVIFKRIEPTKYEVLYNAQDWLFELLPETKSQKSFRFAQNSLYLEDFLIDAEALWISKQPGSVDSGIWSETLPSRELLQLEASAMVCNQQEYLVIHKLKDKFTQKQQTLQIARELLLSNDKITEQHEHLHAQMDELLSQSERTKAFQQPIINALEQTDLGVAILDSNLQLVKGNPALQTLFNDTHIALKLPVDRLILELFKKQYPEYDRVFSTRSAWTGELCWLNPPEQGKWLKVAIHPIKNADQALQYWMFSVSDVTQIKFLLKRNEKLTHFDVLTDLPNRQYFWQQLENKIKKNRPFYLLYIDIKNFKRINEVHGHLIGDQLIKDLAKRLQSVTRVDDYIARIGGTEFAIIMETDYFRKQFASTDQGQCKTFVQELIRASELPFYLESGSQCEIGLNVGASAFPTDSNDAEELMKYADLAVFAAKKQVKSSLEFYSKKLVDASLKRIEMEDALQKAVTNKQFELFLQPIIDISSSKIVKAETLIRWRLSDGSIIAPDEFIPLAEQTGLIVPIGKWVIAEACRFLNELKKTHQEIKLSVNLSPRQVADRQLLDFIKTTLTQQDISPELLELELTEGVLIDNYDKVHYLLTELRTLGISVSIDDFGTGYSSLSYLQKLPIDHIKIDRSFTMSIQDNEQDQGGNSAIILAVIAMAKSLKLGVIAEGVETDSQKEFLLRNQCHIAQGYLFSRPLPFNEFCKLLNTKN